MPDPAVALHAAFTSAGDGRLRAGLLGHVPDPLPVGRGQVLRLEGHCWHPRARVARLALLLDRAAHPVAHLRRPRPDLAAAAPPWDDPRGHAADSGFLALVPVGPVAAPRPAPLALEARLADGSVHRAELGAIRLVPREEVERAVLPPPRPGEEGPPVAICMATYEPPLDLLESQLDSLVAQTHRRWICVVNDDASSPERWAGLLRLTARDPRFQVFRNSTRLGFLRNFERALHRVPDGAAFVALSDQDDRWYPDKLAACLAALRPGVQLAYCDMHVVTRDDRPIADTFWTAHRNNWTDLASLLLVNTVTGAASVFRAELLELVLPFPAPLATPFHDHWIAAVALASGALAYVDRPLYAYRQHGANALGHPAPRDARLVPGADELWALACAPAASLRAARAALRREAAAFADRPLRVAQLARILGLRCAPRDAEKAAALELARRFDGSARALARAVVAHGWRRRPTFGEERRLLRSLLADRALGLYRRARATLRPP